MPLISLTTDFGDLYPAAMKAVILSVNPDARIVDITHSIPQAGIRQGAFALYSLVPYFPEGTVHVGVVDPGVGTSRRALVVKAGEPGRKQFFVGPDNGLLIPAALRLGKGDIEVYEVTNKELMLHSEISSTFHGRDIFSPVGAHLSMGTPVEDVGWRITDFVDLDFGKYGIDGRFLFGEVLLADSFGNVITNIPEKKVLELCPFGSKLEVNGREVPFLQTYGLVEQGEPLALIGSHGFLEIGINQGNASFQLALKSGDPVEIRIL